MKFHKIVDDITSDAIKSLLFILKVVVHNMHITDLVAFIWRIKCVLKHLQQEFFSNNSPVNLCVINNKHVKVSIEINK